MKKGQISFFLLISFVLLLSFSFVFYLDNNAKSETQISKPAQASYDSIKTYLEECVRLSAKQSILSNALQGGFYNETENSLTHSFFAIPLYSKGYTKLAPPPNKLEEQLSFNVEDRIISCIGDFKIFREKGYEINFKRPASKTTILENKVIFDVNFPVIVKLNGASKSFNNFYTEIPSRYKLAYTIADNISNQLSITPGSICISCLVDYAHRNSLNISVTSFNEQSIAITIIDNKIKINNKETVFNFAHNLGGAIA